MTNFNLGYWDKSYAKSIVKSEGDKFERFNNLELNLKGHTFGNISLRFDDMTKFGFFANDFLYLSYTLSEANNQKILPRQEILIKRIKSYEFSTASFFGAD